MNFACTFVWHYKYIFANLTICMVFIIEQILISVEELFVIQMEIYITSTSLERISTYQSNQINQSNEINQ